MPLLGRRLYVGGALNNVTLSTASRAAATERQVARTAISSPAVAIGRLGFLARGAVYLVVGWLALGAAQFALGAGSVGKGSDASTQDWTGRLLQAPFGPPLLIAVGAIFLAVAVAEFISAYKVDFRKELNLDGLGADTRATVVLL